MFWDPFSVSVFLLFKIINFESSPAASPARAPSPDTAAASPARSPSPGPAAASPARSPSPGSAAASPGPAQVAPPRRRQRILISSPRRPAGPAPKRRRVTAGRPRGLRDEAYDSGKFNCNVVDP